MPVDSRRVVPMLPLVVTPASHVVVLEYEAWFGPRAVTFQHAEAVPWLRSKDMQPVGGGYDSADPHVIAQHVAWMEQMGVDAVTVDLTNNVGCIFSVGPVSSKFCDPATDAFRQSNRVIAENTGNLYPAWTQLGTPLKIIPLLGCQTWRDVAVGSDGKTGFEKEVEYFGGLMNRFSGLRVLYENRPLLLFYTGTPVNTTLLSACEGVLHRTGLADRYTFRAVGGYLESQPTFWNDPNEVPSGPIQLAPQHDLWSVVDRLKPSYHYYPTYDLAPGDPQRIENLTVSVATAGQSGWGCPEPTYCPDAALRYGASGSHYQTLEDFMGIARQLEPTFLIVDQFNEFAQPDEGWNAQTSDDIEPTYAPLGWGIGALEAVRAAIAAYRR